MANNPDQTKEAQRGGTTKSAEGRSAGTTDEQRTADAASQAPASPVVVDFFTDHTPPPILIENGSINIETNEPLTHSAGGTTEAHPHLHRRRTERPILGLRILNDSGETIHLDERAMGTSIKIWWDKRQGTEQIFIDGSTLTIEADVDLGAGVDIARPPQPTGNPPTRRIKRYVHPSTNGKGIVQVEVVKNGASSIFTARVDKVMIWDTTD